MREGRDRYLLDADQALLTSVVPRGFAPRRRRSNNPNPEDSTDPPVPPLRLISKHDDCESHDACGCQYRGIRASPYALKALEQQLGIFNSRQHP